MKLKVAAVIAGVVAVAAVVAAAIFINYYSKSDKIISFDAQSNGETLEFSCDNMYPGEVRTSDYKLESKFSGNLILSFVEGTKSDLMPYLNAKISVDGQDVYNGPLEDIMETSLVSYVEKGGADFSVSFWIDLSTDNSAQGLEAVFYLDMKVERA